MKVHLCLYVAAATAFPAAVPLAVGAALGDRPLEWVGVPAGLVGGAGLLAVATRAAVARVRDQGPELLAAMWAR